MATDPRLAIYIRDSFSKGYSRDAIRDALIKKGWDVAAVDEALKGFGEAAPPEAMVPQPVRQAEVAQPAKPKSELHASKSNIIRVVSVTGISLSVILIIGGIIDIMLVQYPTALEELRLLNETVDITQLELGDVTLVGVLDWMSFVPIILGLMGLIMFFSILFNTTKLLIVVVIAIGITSIVVGILQSNYLMPIVWIVVIGLLLYNRDLLTK
ncbi:MAG: hypothetical protein JSV63_03645 [Candidatus Aenigmatarchaeota archaeon]|nr:MAG: hypothetical protein JSV63_03645 [Candidatus Aenigmarchaeota archaeon]